MKSRRNWRNGTFLDDLKARKQRYVVEVAVNTTVWTAAPASLLPPRPEGRGRPLIRLRRDHLKSVTAAAANLPADAWHAYQLRDGRCGSLVFEFAAVRGVGGSPSACGLQPLFFPHAVEVWVRHCSHPEKTTSTRKAGRLVMKFFEHKSALRPISLLWPMVIIAVLTLLALTWHWRLQESPEGIGRQAATREITPRGELADDEKTTIAIFREVSPAVVHITTLSVRQDAFTLDLQQIPKGTGSGFVWDENGHIVTNYHVIQGADAAQATFADQTVRKARLVGAYPDRDLAVLAIDARNLRLQPIPLGASRDLQVGQKVFAIGNPFGLDQSLTTGVVSALGRQIESVNRRPIKDMIQTDAAINPGNSGGPLLDSAGRLIGVNAAIYSPSGAFAGIGFAIPVDEVNRVVPQLIRHGKVTQLGFGVQFAPDQIARQLGLKGLLVLRVEPGGPAAKAGMRPTRQVDDHRVQLGDVITAIDGTPIRSMNDLRDALEQREPGQIVTVTMLRDGKEHKVKVNLVAV